MYVNGNEEASTLNFLKYPIFIVLVGMTIWSCIALHSRGVALRKTQGQLMDIRAHLESGYMKDIDGKVYVVLPAEVDGRCAACHGKDQENRPQTDAKCPTWVPEKIIQK
jgi:hypothetical protein